MVMYGRRILNFCPLEAIKGGPFQSISHSKFVAADLTVHLKVLLRRFFVIFMSKFVCRNDIWTSKCEHKKLEMNHFVRDCCCCGGRSERVVALFIQITDGKIDLPTGLICCELRQNSQSMLKIETPVCSQKKCKKQLLIFF